MEPSSRLLRILKILGVTGIVVNGGALLMLLIILLAWNNHAPAFYLTLWSVFSIGIPLYGLLFVAIKLREQFKRIEVALSAR
jgi:hypothetical protein